MVTLILAFSYFLWGGWRNSRMLPTTMTVTDEPDTGMSPPSGVEETEIAVEAASHTSPSAPNRPAS